MVETHWPLTLGLVLIAGFGSWVFLHSNRSYLLRWAVIPLSLIVAVASAQVYDAGLGYAVATALPDKFVYLGHQVVIEQMHKTGIEVWAQAARTRLYRVPYTKPMEEALNYAHEQARGGLPVMMQRPPGGKDRFARASADRSSGPPYDSRVLLPSDINPKHVPAVQGLADAK